MSYELFWKACEAGDLSTVKSLASKIDDINMRNPHGWNAMILATYNHHLPLMAYLLDIGADINSTNPKGTTVFMYAKTKVFQNSNYEILDFLLDRGAEINKRDTVNNWTVLDYVKAKGDDRMVAYLEAKGAV